MGVWFASGLVAVTVVEVVGTSVPGALGWPVAEGRAAVVVLAGAELVVVGVVSFLA